MAGQEENRPQHTPAAGRYDALLRRFGAHGANCNFVNGSISGICNCGWAEVEKELRSGVASPVPTERPKKCKHENFNAHVDVNRIEDIGRFTADVRIRCAQCDLPFEFVGVGECGLSYEHPTVNPSAQELRIPIKPKGCEILPGMKGPTGFKVERAQ